MINSEIRSITGLRAVAALSVYLNHFGNPAWFPNRLSNIQSNGGFAVPFFFVLSGFVLTLAYDGQKIDARAFYLNRLARIGPTYFVALFIAVAYVSLSGFTFDHIFIMHLLGLQAWFPTSDSGFAFNGPGWTISVEIFFYALFPILFSLLNSNHAALRRWQSAVLFGLSLSIIPFIVHVYTLGEMHGLKNSYIWPYFLPFHYLGLFVLGIGGFKARNSIQTFFPSKFLQSLLCDAIVVASTLLFFCYQLKEPGSSTFSKCGAILASRDSFCFVHNCSVSSTVFTVESTTWFQSFLVCWKDFNGLLFTSRASHMVDTKNISDGNLRSEVSIYCCRNDSCSLLH